MKRWLFHFAAALSLLLSLAAAAAWTMSYARPGWRLIGTAHSADMTRVNSQPRTARFAITPGWSKAPNHGFWDALWVLSQSGRLTLLAQAIDYDGTLRQVAVSPPSLIVDPAGDAQLQAVVFDRMPDSGPTANRLGFGFDSDAQLAFADALRFNPWHSLPEHRPLGSSNRARRRMYTELAALRQRMNATAHVEPTGAETFPDR